MERKLPIILIVIILLFPILSVSNAGTIYNNKRLDGQWHYLPSYPNYAPNGLPDFDQRQEASWRGPFSWAFCGPTALADVLWWFDSKHSDQNGYPGDGVDNYPLVSKYNIPSVPEPGPNKDDHNYNNVNDLATPWNGSYNNGELIEQIANYVDIYWYKIPCLYLQGTDRFSLTIGTRKWIKDAGLEDKYKVEDIYKPSFELIKDRVIKNQGVILRLGYYIPDFNNLFPIIFGHYVAVAGVNPDGYIAICDPKADITNPCNDRTLHNNAGIVSHDIYKIDENTPYPTISKWWIPKYGNHRSLIVIAAIIISEIE